MIRDLLLRGIKQQVFFKVTSLNCRLAIPENLIPETSPPFLHWRHFLGNLWFLRHRKKTLSIILYSVMIPNTTVRFSKNSFYLLAYSSILHLGNLKKNPNLKDNALKTQLESGITKSSSLVQFWGPVAWKLPSVIFLWEGSLSCGSIAALKRYLMPS